MVLAEEAAVVMVAAQVAVALTAVQAVRVVAVDLMVLEVPEAFWAAEAALQARVLEAMAVSAQAVAEVTLAASIRMVLVEQVAQEQANPQVVAEVLDLGEPSSSNKEPSSSCKMGSVFLAIQRLLVWVAPQPEAVELMDLRSDKISLYNREEVLISKSTAH